MRINYKGKVYLATDAMTVDSLAALRTADAFGLAGAVIDGLLRAGLIEEVAA